MKNIVKAITGSALLISGAILSSSSHSINGKEQIINFSLMILGILLLIFSNIRDNKDNEDPSSNENESN